MKLLETIEGFGSQLIFEMKENAPTLCIIGAGLCAVGAVIAAVKASKKADADIQEAKAMVEDIREESVVDGAGELTVPKDETNAKIVQVWLKLALRLTRRYALTVCLLIICFLLMAKSNDIHIEREAGLFATIGLLQETQEAYRKDVAKVLGEEKERDIWDGVQTVKKVVGKDLDGNDIVEEEKEVVNYNNRIIVLTKENMMPGYYKPNHMAMGAYLRAQEHFINHTLAIKGYVMENVVYADYLNLNPAVIDPEGQKRGKLRDGVAFSLNLREVFVTDEDTGERRKEWAIQPNFSYGVAGKVFLHRSIM